jgi:hypothetical protein
MMTEVPDYTTVDMWLVYTDRNGDKNYQHWRDLVECGTLIDPVTGDDMELVGWLS